MYGVSRIPVRDGVVPASGQGVDALIQEVIDTTPAALASVASRLPTGSSGAGGRFDTDGRQDCGG
jgi:hypothetical protein